MTANIIDNECMDQIKAGSDEGLCELMSRYSRAIKGFYFRRGIKDDVCEDLLQEVFTKVWTKASAFRSGENVRSWLFVVARNIMYDHLRYERRKHRETVFSCMQQEDGDRVSDVQDCRKRVNVDTSAMLDMAGSILTECQYGAFEDMVAFIDTHTASQKHGVCDATIVWRKMSAVKALRKSQRFVSEFSPDNV